MTPKSTAKIKINGEVASEPPNDLGLLLTPPAPPNSGPGVRRVPGDSFRVPAGSSLCRQTRTRGNPGDRFPAGPGAAEHAGNLDQGRVSRPRRADAVRVLGRPRAGQ